MNPDDELHLETFTIEPDDPRRPLLEYIVRTREFVNNCTETVPESLGAAARAQGAEPEIVAAMTFGIRAVCEGIVECMGNDLAAALGSPVRPGETAHIMGADYEPLAGPARLAWYGDAPATLRPDGTLEEGTG